jgi:integrase
VLTIAETAARLRVSRSTVYRLMAEGRLRPVQGVHMKHVAEQLGHRSVSTTDRYYAHVAPTVLQDNVRLLNRRKA